ncbi:MAG: hypothetical protein AAGJ83_11205, partial [Planctomycetota bacterium]
MIRLLNPKKGDAADPKALAEEMDDVSDPQAAVDGLSESLPVRLAGDPRVISAAVRWLSRNAKIHISNVHDPHTGSESESTASDAKDDREPVAKETVAKETVAKETVAKETVAKEPAATPTVGDPNENVNAEVAEPVSSGNDVYVSADVTTDARPSESEPVESNDVESNDVESKETVTNAAEPSHDGVSDASPVGESEAVVAASAEVASPTPEDSSSPETGSESPEAASVAEVSPQGEALASSEEDLPGFAPDPEPKPAEKPKAAPKKSKKISPRQRRRRWLVSVLKPLEGKRMPATKLSAFQVVMLGRALRSQVAVCAFEYDAARLVGEIKRTIVGLNKNIESMLGDLVMKHEADIREAAETAWWDELHERASARLVTVVADQLRKHVNRGAVEAKVIMSIDAVGPKTAATSIVSADGRVLHGEDIPCQLTANTRSQTVAKMGELIHKYAVDLVVISNGPARRACLIALGDLIGQSPEGSLRWTIAERSGADSYSSSNVANSEMRSTPRRFRAAAWIAFSVLHPAQAYAKVDPLRLRLASFQSELSDDALSLALRHILSSGASRGGVDVNAAPSEWLEQLPGMTSAVAEQLAKQRENQLLQSRGELATLPWSSSVHSRQALPFLRIYESAEVLDGTLIHPDDYALAKKLASALEIELPPATPPGYERPNYTVATEAEPKLVDATTPEAPAPVEDFDHAGEKAEEFKLDAETAEPDSSVVEESPEVATDSADASDTAGEASDSSSDSP